MLSIFTEKGRLLSSIRKGGVPLFLDIPAELVDDNVVMQWLSCQGNYINQVPVALLSKKIKNYAVAACPENVNFMTGCNKDELDELVLKALERMIDPFSSINLALISPSILSRYVSGTPKRVDNYLSRRSWSSESERLLYIDKFASLNPHNVHLVDISCVSDESLIRAYKGGRPPYSFYDTLEKGGRLNIFKKVAQSGYWPITSDKPSSLRKAIARIMCCKDFEEYYILCGFVQTCPVEDACRLMAKNPRRLILLMELFSSDELMPHLKENTTAKTKILKSDMGL
jgi:hypothetical protein